MTTNQTIKIKVRWTGYVSLVLAILFFSGLFMNAEGPLRVLDFSNIIGQFGKLGSLVGDTGKLAPNFKGVGGTGIREAFLFGLTLVPSIMFALGIITVIENLDGLKAAQKLLTPLMRVLFGVSGALGLGVIANLQSSDTSAMITRDLYENGTISEKERIIFTAYQYPAPGTVVNYFAIGAVLFSIITVPVSLPLVVIFVCKVIGCNMIRLFINKIVKAEDENVRQSD